MAVWQSVDQKRFILPVQYQQRKPEQVSKTILSLQSFAFCFIHLKRTSCHPKPPMTLPIGYTVRILLFNWSIGGPEMFSCHIWSAISASPLWPRPNNRTRHILKQPMVGNGPIQEKNAGAAGQGSLKCAKFKIKMSVQ